MSRGAIFNVLFALALTAVTTSRVMTAADDRKAEVLLQAGMAKETVQGDFKGAI